MNKEIENKIGLVIAAHPDDAEFGAGGTTALLIQKGWEMHYLVMTDGSKGTGDASLQPELVKIREKEQQDAAKAIGVKSCEFAGGIDGELEYKREHLAKIVKSIRTIQPHTVFTHSPDIVRQHTTHHIDTTDPLNKYHASINHRDHRLTGEMALDAIYPTARDVLNFPEQLEQGLETHKVKEIFLWGTHHDNYKKDISKTIDEKIKALTHHSSQVSEEQLQKFKQQLKSKDGKYYENFQRIILLR